MHCNLTIRISSNMSSGQGKATPTLYWNCTICSCVSRIFLLIYFRFIDKFRISNKSVFGIPGFVVTQHCGTTTSGSSDRATHVTRITRTGPSCCNLNLWKGDDNPIKYNTVSISCCLASSSAGATPVHSWIGSATRPRR